MFRNLVLKPREDLILQFEDKTPAHELVCVDQFAAQDFNLNDCGWIRNDLSAAVRAQSLTEYQAIVQRLVEIKSDGGIPDDMSIDEAISLIKPRWAQSPNELEIFMNMTNDGAMQHLTEAYEKATSNKIVTEDIPQAPVSRSEGDGE